MSYLAGFRAEGDYLQALFKGAWSLPVAWSNTKFAPPDNAPWSRFTVRHPGAEIASMGAPGANLRRYDGMIVIEIFVPLGDGDGELDSYCDQAAAIFRDHTDQQGLRFGEPYTVPVGSTGSWFKRDLLVPFVRDTVYI